MVERGEKQEPPKDSGRQGAGGNEPKELIGSATMDAQRRITLDLHTLTGGPHGEAQVNYDSTNPLYDEVLKHLGGIKPGEKKGVTPWPDQAVTPRFREHGLGGDTTIPPVTPKQQQPIDLPALKQKAQDAEDALAQPVRDLLGTAKLKFVAVDKVTDAAPELAGQHPRGWPPGTTWDNCDGLFDESRRQMVVAAEHMDNGVWVANSSPQGVARHETGHGINFALGMYSNDQAFETAYDADLKTIPADAQKRLEYFLQSGSSGRDETFAEVFAHVQGGTSYPGYEQDIGTYFKLTAKAISDRLAQLP